MKAADSSLGTRYRISQLFQSFGVYLGLAVLLVVSAVVSPQSFNPQDLLNRSPLPSRSCTTGWRASSDSIATAPPSAR